MIPRRDVAMWLSGLSMGIFLMVADELISLSLYCGLKCGYPIPLLGTFNIWDAWALTFGCQLTSMTVTLLIIGEKQRVA